MALLDSKQLNPRLTGSFTLSGSLVTDSASTGSFGYLNVAGNTNLVGDLTLGGDIQIGDSTGDSITITADLTSNLIPNTDSTYDLGTSTKNWRFGYIEQIVSDSVTITGNVSGSATSTGSFGRVETAGDINVSGNVRGSRFEIDGATDYIDQAFGNLFIVTTGDIAAQPGTGKALKVTGGIEATSHITASGDVYVSGNVSGSSTSTGSFGSLVVDDKVQGDLTIGNSLISNKGATFNAAQSSAHDFRALSANKNYMLYVDANKDKVGIGFQNPEGNQLSSSLHIAGDLMTDSHITGSGNINTTAGRVFEQGTSVIDHATAMAIVFGG
jgi:hypothetical protein